MLKIFLLLALFILLPSQTHAALATENTECEVVYGGGVGCARSNPTITPSEPQSVIPETKGGQPVLERPATKEIPNTGPEMLGLVALAPTGLLGLYLRRKSSK